MTGHARQPDDCALRPARAGIPVAFSKRRGRLLWHRGRWSGMGLGGRLRCGRRPAGWRRSLALFRGAGDRAAGQQRDGRRLRPTRPDFRGRCARERPACNAPGTRPSEIGQWDARHAPRARPGVNVRFTAGFRTGPRPTSPFNRGSRRWGRASEGAPDRRCAAGGSPRSCDRSRAAADRWGPSRKAFRSRRR